MTSRATLSEARCYCSSWIPNSYHPDLAHILGLTEHQVRYAVRKGLIPVGAGVDPWGRLWTEGEVEEGLVDMISTL